LVVFTQNQGGGGAVQAPPSGTPTGFSEYATIARPLKSDRADLKGTELSFQGKRPG